MLLSPEEEIDVLKLVFSFALHGSQVNCSSSLHVTVNKVGIWMDSSEGKSRSC